MDRRTFLQLCSGAMASSLGLGCGASGSGDDSTPPGDLSAGRAPWGIPPSGSEHLLLPGEAQPEAMLEVFLLGGMSPWESFYTIPEYCNPSMGGPYAGQQWWMFDGGVEEWFAQCDGGDRAIYEPFAADAAGMTVNLGPFIYPLRDRPDILSRMRVWVVHHAVEPHAIAIPFAVAGHGVSNPRMAGFGTHLQRFFGQQESGARNAPLAYTIYMSSFDRSNNGTAATALGLHPAAAQPLALQLGPNPRLPARLPRPTVSGHKNELDALVAHYTERIRQRLSHAVTGDYRSPGYMDYAAARRAMQNHEALVDLLPSSIFEVPEVTMCTQHPLVETQGVFTVTDETTAALEMARHLITVGKDAPRYVQVMEGGVFTDPAGQGYDTHGEHIRGQGPNLMHMSRGLAAIINEPGEEDPRKLDLDRHFILLNTEFGRAPIPEATPPNPHGRGTNHWPWGYVVVGFGGFADEERAGIVGAIGEDGYATSSFTPTEHRAAMLLAMGVWPFSPESFAVGDVRGAGSELEAALKLRTEILGYPV